MTPSACAMSGLLLRRIRIIGAIMKSVRLAIATILATSSLSLFGAPLPPYRIWTAKDGKKLIAEYRGQVGDDIFLSTESNKSYRVSIYSLSIEDRQYLSSAPSGLSSSEVRLNSMKSYSNVAINAAQRSELLDQIRGTRTDNSAHSTVGVSVMKPSTSSIEDWDTNEDWYTKKAEQQDRLDTSKRVSSWRYWSSGNGTTTRETTYGENDGNSHRSERWWTDSEGNTTREVRYTPNEF